MTAALTLPSAWQSSDSGNEVVKTVVALDDLANGVAVLAAAFGATRHEILFAAHIKVLGMLTADWGLSTEVIDTGGGPALTVSVDRPLDTWRETVERSVKMLRSADPAPRTEPSEQHADQVLFAPTEPADEPYGLQVVPVDDGLRLVARTAAVARDRFATLAAMYRLAVEAMVADIDGDALAAGLPVEERGLVLHDWARGESTARGPETVDVLIHAQAERTPDSVAVRSDQGNLSFRELDERANRIAHLLIGLGVQSDSLVGVCLRRGPDLLPAFLGVWRAGAGYVPLDPDLPTDRLRLMVESAGCESVVTEAAQLPLFRGMSGARFILMDEHREQIGAQPSVLPDSSPDPERIAYVIYTSGSTGEPKGVMVEHRGLANYLLWTVEAYASWGTGGSAAFTSISFDLGIPTLFTPLLAGQPVHLLPDPLPVADLGECLVAGGPYGFLKMTPGQLDHVSLDLTPDELRDLAGLAIAAGDAFTSDLAGRWIEAVGSGGTAIATEYGPTEITIGNSGYVVTEPPQKSLVPLGQPIPNTTMYVLTDRLEPVPIGVPGEVYIGGEGVARGYLNRPDLTEQRFLPDPYDSPTGRLYRTGDRARWLSDGALEFLGRVDHQIKIRGYRVEPGEVQEQLRNHSDVAEAVVVATGDSLSAQSLAAFVIPQPGAEPTAADLRRSLTGRLPAYMIPTHFVIVDRFPLTANGKVDVKRLRSRIEP